MTVYRHHVVSVALLAWVAQMLVAHAEALTGHVVNVHDGDTLIVLFGSQQEVKVRLSGIDAPELSKQAFSDLAFGKDARIESSESDRHGRTLGTVYVGSVM